MQNIASEKNSGITKWFLKKYQARYKHGCTGLKKLLQTF